MPELEENTTTRPVPPGHHEPKLGYLEDCLTRTTGYRREYTIWSSPLNYQEASRNVALVRSTCVGCFLRPHRAMLTYAEPEGFNTRWISAAALSWSVRQQRTRFDRRKSTTDPRRSPVRSLRTPLL